MQTIGERLEEARKRKGISLREAAEATKIRGDFLSSIEQNHFDFDLPDIYKRGFLKNYARYLKLDVEKILTDYNAQLLSNSRLGKKAGSEWFGQMEIKKPERAEPAESDAEAAELEQNSASMGRIFPRPSVPKAVAQTEREPELEPEDPRGLEEESEKTFYLKIGLIFVGTLALVFVIFGLIWAILGSGGSDPAIEQPEPTVAETSEPAVSSDSITLRASGDVRVLVRQQSDGAELYRGSMADGDSETLEKTGAVDVLFTAGEHLTIEHGGDRMRPSASGTARVTIP